MNRIILIGNGFDLANGLKTSYNDFIEDVFKKIFLYLNSDEPCDFIDKIYTKHCDKFNDKAEKNELDELRSYLDIFQEYSTKNNRRKGDFSPAKDFSLKNIFLKKFMETKGQRNWNSIEDIYYQELLSAIKGRDVETRIKQINIDFELIIDLLQNYLNEVSSQCSISLDTLILDKMTSDLDPDELCSSYESDYKGDDTYIDSYLFLNFNYTSTPRIYSEEVDNSTIINIHGELNSESNPIIFGYGDELDEDYPLLENSKIDECLDYIKSIKYVETSNYKKLINYLQLSKYQVIVLGHSCGNTDRTLLNTIFEHDNCVSIKPYYYEYKNDKGEIKDNFSELAKNILRNFKNNRKFRDRLVDKTNCIIK